MIQHLAPPLLTPQPLAADPRQLSVQGPLEWALETGSSRDTPVLLGLQLPRGGAALPPAGF